MIPALVAVVVAVIIITIIVRKRKKSRTAIQEEPVIEEQQFAEILPPPKAYIILTCNDLPEQIYKASINDIICIGRKDADIMINNILFHQNIVKSFCAEICYM